MNNRILRRWGKIGCALAGGALMLGVPGPAGAKSRPKEITIYYLVNGDENDLGRAATIVKRNAGTKTGLFLVLGDVFKSTLRTALFDGRAEAALLEAAGVDAVLFSEGFFLLGRESVRTLPHSAGFHFLGVNLKDGETNRPFAAGYLIKNFGSVRFGLAGIVPDYFPLAGRLKWFAFADPESTLRRVVPMLRFRTDLLGIVGSKTARADFGWTAAELEKHPVHSLGRIRLVAKGKAWLEKHDVIQLDTAIAVDSLFAATARNYQRAVDSLGRKIEPAGGFAGGSLVQAVTRATGVDEVAFGPMPDRLDSLFNGGVPAGGVWFNHLPIFDMPGSELGSVGGKPADTARNYRVATEMSRAETDPLFKDKKFDLSARSLVGMALDYPSHEGH